MATVNLTTSPTQIDDGTSVAVLITNTGASDVELSRGGRLRPAQSRTVYPEGAALSAAALSGTGQVSTVATAAPTSQAAQLAANTAAIAGLPGTYARKTGATIALLGDSITAAGGIGMNDANWGTDNNLFQGPFGWITWALTAVGSRLTLVRNAGVSGNTTAQMLARVSTDVISYQPTYCTVMGGRNDIDGLVSSSTTYSNLTAICAALLNAGVQPILCTILPCSTETAGQIAQREALNKQIVTYAKTTPGVILCDWASVWTDPATGLPLTSPAVTTDGKHPNRDGATRLGYVLGQVLAALPLGTSDLVGWNGDSRSLGQNPCLTGTTGNKGTGITGTVATGWTVNPITTATATCSLVARTDGQPGNWQQIQITGAGSSLQLFFTGYTTSRGTLWTPGTTKFYIEAEFQRDTDWSGVTLFGAQSYLGGQSNQVYANFDFASGSHGAGSIFPTSGVLRSPVALTNASATSMGVGVRFYADAGTLRLGRVALRAY